ncbi:MAG: hypothetical protein PHV33_11975 [Elusimicrobiales bacterium]|nr:hypothetical protein [Elusimicrobiales bacterium]
MSSQNIIKFAGIAVLAGSVVYGFFRQEAAPTVSAEASGTPSAVAGPGNQPRAEAAKIPGVSMAPESERPPYNPVEENITAQTSGVTEVKVGTTSFLVYGTGVYLYSADEEKWRIIAELPIPDGSLFKKYRPKAEIWSYETEIGPAAGAPGKVWAGYKFYNGEGFNGIGGAVFYDIVTGDIGVLRHPALLDCSIGAISVSEERLVARTSRDREGSSTVCNGIVVIDFKTLKAVSYLPAESDVITDHDPAPGAKLLGGKYNVPLDKVLSGEAGFEKKDAPNWSDAQREKILSEGLVPHMVRTALEEARSGMEARAARPKDVRSDHMWIDNSRAAREALQAPPEEADAAGTGDIDEKEVPGVFSGLAKREFMKVYSGLTDITALRPDAVELSGKEGTKKYYCICAIAQDPAHTDYDSGLSFDENAKHSRVGCFVLSGTRPARILKLADMPTRRWRDYSGRCVSGEVENEVTVTFSGDTYGDQVVSRRYSVDPVAWTSELISESSGKP